MIFKRNYFLAFLLLVLIEILIAQTKGFIRHTFGDFLVVILLYCLVKTFLNIPSKTIAIGVLVFAFSVEFLQLTPFLSSVGLQHNKWARILFGATFSVGDLCAYTLGILTVFIIEKQCMINGYSSR